MTKSIDANKKSLTNKNFTSHKFIMKYRCSFHFKIILTGSSQVKIIAGFRGIPTFNATGSKPGFIKLKLEQNGVDTSRREPFHGLTVLQSECRIDLTYLRSAIYLYARPCDGSRGFDIPVQVGTSLLGYSTLGTYLILDLLVCDIHNDLSRNRVII